MRRFAWITVPMLFVAIGLGTARAQPQQRSTEDCPPGFSGNHGQFVSGQSVSPTAEGERSEAAQSDCGKPLTARDGDDAAPEVRGAGEGPTVDDDETREQEREAREAERAERQAEKDQRRAEREELRAEREALRS